MVEGLSDSKFEIIVLFGGAVRVSRRADVLAKTTFRSNDSSVRCISSAPEVVTIGNRVRVFWFSS